MLGRCLQVWQAGADGAECQSRWMALGERLAFLNSADVERRVAL